MATTSVELDEADAQRLALLAEQEGLSPALLLSKAIQAYVPAQRVERRFAMDGAGTGPGGSIADIDDADLMVGFGE